MRTENHPYPSSERFLVRASLFLTVLALAASARGDPFYLRYDGDEVYPEQAGWCRNGQDPGGAEKRSLDDGWLTLDTRGSYDIWDVYYARSAAFEVRPGEEFRVAWRMQVLQTDMIGWQTDVCVFISNGATEYAEIVLAPDYVAHTEYGMEQPDHLYAFQSGVPHGYLLTSSDMKHFRLTVDGQYAFSGTFLWSALIGGNYVSFGDGWTGLRSLSRWDYVQIEVVPEPSAMVLTWLTGAVLLFLARRFAS